MKKLFAVMSIVAVLGAGCAADTTKPVAPAPVVEQPSTAGKMSMAQFMTGSWKIKSMQTIGGPAQDVSTLGLTLGFDGEKMSGKVCNSMSGPYTVEDNLVKFGTVMQTKMFCEGLPGQVEAAFTSGFSTNYTISKQGNDLVMQGASVFVLERMGSTATGDGGVY